MSGKLYLRLNLTLRLIANKYREGKLKKENGKKRLNVIAVFYLLPGFVLRFAVGLCVKLSIASLSQ